MMLSSTRATINLEDIDLAAIQANSILNTQYSKLNTLPKKFGKLFVQDRLISPVGMVNQFALQAETTGLGALGWVAIGDFDLPSSIFNPET